eukprot:s562_g14.t1
MPYGSPKVPVSAMKPVKPPWEEGDDDETTDGDDLGTIAEEENQGPENVEEENDTLPASSTVPPGSTTLPTSGASALTFPDDQTVVTADYFNVGSVTFSASLPEVTSGPSSTLAHGERPMGRLMGTNKLNPSAHCRISSAISRSQWALPDFIRELQIPVGTAGLQSRLPDPSGHCRTSVATARSQWALPDFSRELQISVGTAGLQSRAPDCSGHCRTSTCIHARLTARKNAR